MDIDDDTISDSSSEISENERINNHDKLYNTRTELYNIIQYEYKPSTEWYIKEYKNILKYSGINWEQIIHKYQWPDPHLADLAYITRENLIKIIEEYSCKDTFSILLYYEIITNIVTTWEYYYEKYGKKDDASVDELSDIMNAFGL
jgi:hypothetical protein